MSEMYLPNCQKERSAKREFRINIRETLETQVTIEAESEEEALREVERRWKDGEYILDADNFQGVDFLADGEDSGSKETEWRWCCRARWGSEYFPR